MNLVSRLERFRRSRPFEELLGGIRDGIKRLSATNLCGSSTSLLTALLFRETNRTILFLVKSNEQARRTAEDVKALLDEDCVFSLPPVSLTGLDGEMPHMEVVERRMEALAGLLAGKRSIVVLPALTAMQKLISPRRLESLVLHLKVGDLVDMEAFVARLDDLGYVKEDLVMEVGTYSRRGCIVDFFGIRMRCPVRVEFDDERIVSLRAFDPATQRSEKMLERTVLFPVEDGRDLPHESTVFEFVPPDSLIIVDEPADVDREVRSLWTKWSDDRDLIDAEELEKRLGRHPTIALSSLHVAVDDARRTYRFDTRDPVPVNRKFSNFLEALHDHSNEGYQVVLLCDNEGQKERFRELLGDSEGDLELVLGTLEEGFLVPDVGLAVYTDHEIFRRPRRIRYVQEYRGTAPLESFTSIRPGDYLVHINYGIARYEGIMRISAGDGEIECLALVYRDGDRVYVPVDRLSLVEKYSTEETAPPALDRLGSQKWERLKSRTKKSIKEMAKELLDLYAERKVVKGFSFSPDTTWQMELESSFLFEDTPDQSTATQDVKHDMEDPSPMDRLVCGDVGYGKTEVAIRAAFKAVQDGKQVAVLVPTTVLAQQHLMTFRSRLEMFPVNIEMLSRFLSRGEQNEVVAGIRKGTVDIVIGTHRLLSRDVKFRDLGLVIIDEEHRFGVRQKEKLKKMRTNVDVLALSATPIPRTLYLSLMGMRDMSVIETPPRDRMPIATYVLRWDEELIREAIMREVDRGGQVYFIHNRIASIHTVHGLLVDLLPDIRIEVAHGRMKEKHLEEVMLAFLEGDIDVLLSTMIVESGLDISNANTLIVNRADSLGLAQLYQLRGRVGRSNRQANAYLLVPPKHFLDAEARRRLRVLEEYTDLGSGYWIALKDLELRGAGNVLGPQQHGFITSMGFETYYRLLDESVRELKGEMREEHEPIEVVAGVEALLPEEYVRSQDQKLALYRKLSKIEEIGELTRLEDEIMDRFGPMPREARNLLRLVEVKLLSRDLDIRSVSVRQHRITITFRDGLPERTDRWNEVLGTSDSPFHARLDGEHAFTLEVRDGLNALDELIRVLQEISR